MYSHRPALARSVVVYIELPRFNQAVLTNLRRRQRVTRPQKVVQLGFKNRLSLIGGRGGLR